MTPRATLANWASNETKSSRSGAGTKTPTTTSAPTVEEACGGELLDEDTDEVIDVVLLWWRDGDGDLVDTLMDAIGPLAEDGVIWVLTPKTGKPGHVLPGRDRRGGSHRRPDADLVGQPRRLERQPIGAAEVADREALMLRRREPPPPTSRCATRTSSPSPSVPTAAPRTCCWCSSRWRSPGSARASWTRLRDHLPDFENDDSAALAISVGPPPTHKIWALQSGFTFPVLSDFWPHGEVSQAYGVFNDDAGYLQPRYLRRRPVRDHPVRRDETARRGSRPAAVDRRAGGFERLREPEIFGYQAFVACSLPGARARSSVVELWFYTPAVGGSIPSAPTSSASWGHLPLAGETPRRTITPIFAWRYARRPTARPCSRCGNLGGVNEDPDFRSAGAGRAAPSVGPLSSDQRGRRPKPICMPPWMRCAPICANCSIRSVR